jgi:1,4-dihydroxy-2-naphthoate octaprenyltransferase
MNSYAAAGGDASTWQWIATRVRALRTFSFPLSILPVLIAAAAIRPFPTAQWNLIGILALGGVLLHAAGNLFNDYFDYLSGVDRKVDGDEGRPGRLLVKHVLTPKDVLLEAFSCLALALPLAIYLVWLRGPALLWFGLPALFALYAYTGPPFRLKHLALGELLVFIFFGPLLMVGAGYALTGEVQIPVLLLSVPTGIATAAVLLSNNIRDLQEDKAAGVRTLVHKISGAAYVVYIATVLLPPLMVTSFVIAGAVPWGAAACIIALLLAGLLLRKFFGAARLPDADAQMAKYVTVLLLLMLFGLILT